MRKKTIITLIATILFTTIIAEAQIEVKADGIVGVGLSGYNPGDKDFTVINVQNSTSSEWAYSSMRMDNVNNYIYLNRRAPNYRNEIVWYTDNIDYWHFGLNDTDDTPNSRAHSLFIGKYIGGTNPFIWFDNSDCIGLFTQHPDLGYKLTLNGDALALGGGIWQTSDIGLKQNIKKIESALDKLINIRGVTYEYNSAFKELSGFTDSENHNRTYVDSTGVLQNQQEEISKLISNNKYGVIAQEVVEQFPDLVHKGSNGYYAVNYDGLIPVLIEAIKEQQKTIEKIQNDLNGLRESNLKSLSTNVTEDIVLTPTLFQNSPNPFNESTIIKYNLPEAIKEASIIVYDMNGKQIKCITLSTRGESQVSIAAGEFDAGMYIYSLLVDGQLIDTKQMVITD